MAYDIHDGPAQQYVAPFDVVARVLSGPSRGADTPRLANVHHIAWLVDLVRELNVQYIMENPYIIRSYRYM